MTKYKGSIETEISYNDPAETEILLENVDFQGMAFSLHHAIEDDSPAILIDVPACIAYEDLSVHITRGSDVIGFHHQRGGFDATVQEIADALSIARAVQTLVSAGRRVRYIRQENHLANYG